MKKIAVFILMLALVLSCGVMAFAADNGSPVPTPPPSGGNNAGAYAGGAPAGTPKANFGLEVYDKDDKQIDVVPKGQVVLAQVGQAGRLDKADKEAFLAAYKDAKAIKDKVVKYFFWLDTEDYTEPADFAYFKYDFTCKGENVQCQVNGKDMEVVNVDGNDYFAKLTELGAVAILCD